MPLCIVIAALSAGMAAMKMRALGSAEVQDKADAELKKDIAADNGKMKAWPLPTRKQIDLVACVRTLKK